MEYLISKIKRVYFMPSLSSYLKKLKYSNRSTGSGNTKGIYISSQIKSIYGII